MIEPTMISKGKMNRVLELILLVNQGFLSYRNDLQALLLDIERTAPEIANRLRTVSQLLNPARKS